MTLTIKMKGKTVPDDYQYTTSDGRFSRIDLIDRYAETIQYCLAISGARYSPYKAAELLMRAVIGLMTQKGPKRTPKHILNKLELGLSTIGYFPAEGKYDTAPESVIPELHVTGKFPHDDEYYTDYITGDPIGFDGLREYIDLLAKCLSKTQHIQCDEAAFQLVNAVRLLIEQIPNREKREIETLLWKAMQALDFHLDVAPWYKRQLAQTN